MKVDKIMENLTEPTWRHGQVENDGESNSKWTRNRSPDSIDALWLERMSVNQMPQTALVFVESCRQNAAKMQ